MVDGYLAHTRLFYLLLVLKFLSYPFINDVIKRKALSTKSQLTLAYVVLSVHVVKLEVPKSNLL